MAQFTMALWEVLENRDDPAALDPWVEGAGSRIGLADYPIYDETHRDVLNQKILAQYWNREMGLETVDMFTFAVKRRMHRIMPYWNQIYLSTLIEFDPLATFNLETIRNEKSNGSSERTGTNTTTTTNDSQGTGMATDTPQSQLPDDWAENADYASSGSASKSHSDVSANIASGDTSTDESETGGTSTTRGFQGSAADLLARYRAVLVNVDDLVIRQLADLFMQVRSNSEEILPNNGVNTYLSIGWGY